MTIEPIDRSLTRLNPRVWRLIAANPSPLTGPGTNTYLVGQKRLLIIDPGPDDPGHVEAIVAGLHRLQAEPLAVLITHPHPDHQGCARPVAERLQAPLWGFGEPLRHGDTLTVDDVVLQVKHTPGHIQAHLCLWLAADRLLLAGDLVAGQGTILIIPPDGDMGAYIDSLRAMQALHPAAILPGHGPLIEPAEGLLQEYIDHRLAREQQVLHWLGQGLTTAEAIAARIYADRPAALPLASMQVEVHLAKLQREGRF